MARDVIDDRLIGAVHLRALTRSGLLHELPAAHTVVQTGTIAGLMDGHYDGDLRVGDLLTAPTSASEPCNTSTASSSSSTAKHGSRADGSVERVPSETKTPFVVACSVRARRQAPSRHAHGVG